MDGTTELRLRVGRVLHGDTTTRPDDIRQLFQDIYEFLGGIEEAIRDELDAPPEEVDKLKKIIEAKEQRIAALQMGFDASRNLVSCYRQVLADFVLPTRPSQPQQPKGKENG